MSVGVKIVARIFFSVGDMGLFRILKSLCLMNLAARAGVGALGCVSVYPGENSLGSRILFL